MSSRAFYAALVPEQQHAFRAAVTDMREGRAPEAVREAWAALDIGEEILDRRVTIVIWELVEERLALLPESERAPIATALLGGAP
ncbi:hypothetical protein [Methylobacterium dankookense]|uniref:Uncharacterized protein n=1 Tax=Methylobacterium dankookense TaxID=560405 RepID=A0A564FXD9_9HYPH|nr:hypothetical protein [Methylobacterium dankookense]GJD55063.1 hypothetical protein IFDJLNFL_0945 [Methylobacterium dankookense]VUF12061.1 hypothetical protein MTDSW087_01749 [Methylobacterium dankookense]